MNGFFQQMLTLGQVPGQPMQPGQPGTTGQPQPPQGDPQSPQGPQNQQGLLGGLEQFIQSYMQDIPGLDPIDQQSLKAARWQHLLHGDQKGLVGFNPGWWNMGREAGPDGYTGDFDLNRAVSRYGLRGFLQAIGIGGNSEAAPMSGGGN